MAEGNEESHEENSVYPRFKPGIPQMQNKDASHCSMIFDVTSHAWYIQLCVFKQAPVRVKQVATASFIYGRLTHDIKQQPVSAQLQRRPMQNRACGHAIPKQRSGNM